MGRLSVYMRKFIRFLWHEATRGISTQPWMEQWSIAELPLALNPPVSFAYLGGEPGVERCSMRVKCLSAHLHNAVNKAS